MDDTSHVRFRPHPWHGLSPGPEAPDVVDAYVEITPFDLVKYEVDKLTGYMRVDRPQRGAASPPTLYGFIPRTFCAERVRALCPGAARGDGDPLDICIVSERPINRAEILLTARVVGGIQMVDHDEADDKILAVLDRDAFWSTARDVTDLPPALVARLRHYLATYKLVEGEPPRVRLQETYGAAHARRVVEAALADYAERFGAAP